MVRLTINGKSFPMSDKMARKLATALKQAVDNPEKGGVEFDEPGLGIMVINESRLSGNDTAEKIYLTDC